MSGLLGHGVLGGGALNALPDTQTDEEPSVPTDLASYTIQLTDWTPGGDGKIRGLDKDGLLGGGATYGSEGWNDGSSIGTGTQYYADPAGSSGNTGLTSGSPWPLTHAIAQLTAGDTLNLADGTYTDPITPATATQSGTEGQPITVRAANYGNVFIVPTASVPAIEFYSSSSSKVGGWTVDGVIGRTNGEVSTVFIWSYDDSPVANMTHNICIKRVGAFGSAVGTNTTVVAGSFIANCLFEDVFSYGIGRKAFQFYVCAQITSRRLVGRFDYWTGAAYKPNDPRINMSCYNTKNSLFENCLLFDSGTDSTGGNSTRAGMVVSGNETGPSSVTGSTDNLVVGGINLNNVGDGIYNNGGSGGATERCVFRNVVSWNNTGSGISVLSNSDSTTLEYITSGRNGSSGMRHDPYPSIPIVDQVMRYNYSLDNTQHGYYNDSNQFAEIHDNTATGNGNGGELEAAYAPTLTTIVEPVMVVGKERGATILKRTVNGVTTTEDLWPWPYEDIIKANMLNVTDLATAQRTAGGVGGEPGWKTADDISTTSLTEYVLGQGV